MILVQTQTQNGQHIADSVSYTHLDVYKRQVEVYSILFCIFIMQLINNSSMAPEQGRI